MAELSGPAFSWSCACLAGCSVFFYVLVLLSFRRFLAFYCFRSPLCTTQHPSAMVSGDPYDSFVSLSHAFFRGQFTPLPLPPPFISFITAASSLRPRPFVENKVLSAYPLPQKCLHSLN
jgi:hypothetical protein